MEPFPSKVARIVLAPKWRVIFEGRIPVLLTHLFDPNLKIISQYSFAPAPDVKSVPNDLVLYHVMVNAGERIVIKMASHYFIKPKTHEQY